MTPPARTLTLLPGRFAVCRFDAGAALPAWLFHESAHLWCVMRTPDELSVTCPEDDLPPSVERVERGWRALRLDGPIPFAEVGVIAGVTAPLAAAGVPVFVLSTYDTDYVLIKEANLDAARAALGARFSVREIA